MRTFLILIFTSIVLGINFNSCKYKSESFIDGIYKGKSRSKYIEEPYVGISTIHIKKGVIVEVYFKIIDTSKNEIFNGNYEKHFIGNAEYIDQCRNDWKGVQYYPNQLVQKQSVDSIDAMTGATWSCNLFKSSSLEALKRARLN